MTSLEPEQLRFPFSAVLCLFEFSREDAETILTQKLFPVDLLDEHRDDESLQSDVKAFGRAARDSLESKIFCMQGVQDVHYVQSTNFAAERDTWRVDRVYRFGQMVNDKHVLSDDDIFDALAGSDGSGDVFLSLAADPGHKAQFAKLSEGLETFLMRYGWWSSVQDHLKEMAKEHGTIVVARAFCPSDFVTRFAFFLNSVDPDYLPSFDIVFGAPVPTRMVGFVAWDGITLPPAVDDVFDDRGGGANIFRTFMSEQRDVDRLVGAYGLVFPVMTWVGALSPTTTMKCVPIAEWANRFPEAVAELRRALGPMVMPN